MNEHMMPIPSRIYNAAVGGHVAGADQIIDDKTGLTLDKVAGGALEEKEYTSGSDNGMGRVVLRMNLVEGVNTLVQTMINKSNTIYVIQYDFILGENITVPTNCVLEFDGGSIIGNGTNKETITGDNFKIVSNTCCLKNVKFAGASIYNTYKLIWWIKNYPISPVDYTVDNTTEIQDAFNSGVKNLAIPTYKYLYISSTITYKGDMRILTDGNNTPISPDTPANSAKPCIFTKDVITMLDYDFSPSGINTATRNFFIDAITFFCAKPFTDLNDIDTPIINIHNSVACWGSIIKANVKSNFNQITVDGVTFGGISYTGIKITADKSYFSLVRLYGFIYGTYYAYNFVCNKSQDTNNWFNDIRIYGDTYCCIGNKTPAFCTQLIVSGSHQAYDGLLSNNNTAYFTASEIYNANCFIWDLGVNGSKKSAKVGYKGYPEEPTVGYIGPDSGINGMGDYLRVDGRGYSQLKPTFFNYPNLLKIFLKNKTGIDLMYVDFTVNGTSAFNNSKLINVHNLFPDNFISNHIAANAQINPAAWVDSGIATTDEFVYTFTFQTQYTKPDVIYVQGADWNINVKVYACDSQYGGGAVLKSETNIPYNKSYYDGRLNIIKLNKEKDYIRVVITFNPVDTDTIHVLPFVYVPNINKTNNPYLTIDTSKFGYPKFFTYYGTELLEVGFTFFDCSDNKLKICKGNNEWLAFEGTPVV